MAVLVTTPARVVEDARLLLRTVRDEVAEGRRPYVSDIRRLVERGLALRYQQYVQFLERYGFITLDRRADLLAVTHAGEAVAAGREGPLKGLEDDARYYFGDQLQEAPAPARRSLGVRLDTRYLRLESIGRGGLGRVWRGRLLSVDRPVAIKMLDAIEELFRPEDREKMARRFERAVRAHAQLVSPYIVQIFDQNAQHQPPYFVMELAPGGNLRALLDEGPLEPAIALRYFIQIALGLKAAHAVGVVHRDLKPENVLLDASGNVKLSDFGVTRVAERDSGARRAYVGFGSVGYMAPELLRGEVDGTPASDIYALGIVLYEMLTGSLPGRRSPLPSEVVEGLPTAVDDIFDQMARDDLSGRLGTIDEVLEAVYGEVSVCALLTVRGAPAFIDPPRTLPGLPPGEMPEAPDDERELEPTPPPAALAPVSHGPVSHGPVSHGPVSQAPAAHGPVSHGPVAHGPVAHGGTSQAPASKAPVSQAPAGHGAARAPGRGAVEAHPASADDDDEPEPAPADDSIESEPETMPPAAGLMADPIDDGPAPIAAPLGGDDEAAADDEAGVDVSLGGGSRDGSVDVSVAPSIDDVSVQWSPRRRAMQSAGQGSMQGSMQSAGQGSMQGGEVVVPRASSPVPSAPEAVDDEPADDGSLDRAPSAPVAAVAAEIPDAGASGDAVAAAGPDGDPDGDADDDADDDADGLALDADADAGDDDDPAGDEADERTDAPSARPAAQPRESASTTTSTPPAARAPRDSARDRPMPRASVSIAPRPNAPRPRTTLSRSGPIDVSPIRDRISRSVPYPSAPAKLELDDGRDPAPVKDDATDRTAGFAPIDDAALEAQSADVIAAVGNSRIGDADAEDDAAPDGALLESVDEVELIGSGDYVPLDVEPAAFDSLPPSDDDVPVEARPIPRVISAAPAERRPYVAQGTQVLADDAIEFVDDSSAGERRPYVAQGTQVLADEAIEYVDDDEDEDQTAQGEKFRTVIHGRSRGNDPERLRVLEERLERMTGEKP